MKFILNNYQLTLWMFAYSLLLCDTTFRKRVISYVEATFMALDKLSSLFTDTATPFTRSYDTKLVYSDLYYSNTVYFNSRCPRVKEFTGL